MKLRTRVILLSGLFAAMSTSASAVTYDVTATGEAANVAEARKKALTLALKSIMEKANPGTTLETKENWIRMITNSQPEYVIQPQHYKVLSITRPEDNDLKGTAIVKVQVSLPSARLEEIRSHLSEFTKTIGQPTIMVIISDRVEDRRPFSPSVTVRQDVSTAQAVKEKLQQAGFRVIVKSQAEVLRENKTDMAKLRGDDLLAVQAMARKHLAHIFVCGEGRVVGPLAEGHSNPGRTRYVWSADARCEAYWTDDASLIATNHANKRMGDPDPDHSYILALQECGALLAEQMTSDIFGAFCKQALEGRPVSIEVFNCSCDEGDDIADFLKQEVGEEGVLDVQCDNGLVTIRVLSKQRADVLRRKFREHKFVGFHLSSNDSKSNSMQFKVVH